MSRARAEQAAAGLDRPSLRRDLVLVALVVALFCSPLFFTPNGFTSGDPFRTHDWLIAATHASMTRNALLVHGQLPLRSHLVGGGYPVLAHPSDGSLSPLVLTSLLLGERVGLRLNLALALLVGAVGLYLLCRQVLGMTGHGPLLAALAFATAGWHPSRVLVGYYESTLYLLFPAMLYLLLTARRSYIRLVLAVVLTCTCFLQVLGGSVVFALWALTLFSVGLGPGEPAGTRRRRLGALVVVLALATALGAAKFVPTLDLLSGGTMDRMDPALLMELPADPLKRFLFTRSHHFYERFRPGARLGDPDVFYSSPQALLSALVFSGPLQNRYRVLPGGGRQPLLPEYAAIGVGVPVLGLALLALVLLPWLQLARRAAVVLVLFSLVCFGSHLPLDLFYPLSLLPVVNVMRGPVQYFNFVIYVQVVILAGFALAWLQERVSRISGRAWPRALMAGLVLCSLLPGAVSGAARYRQAFRFPLPRVAPEPEFYQVRMDDPFLREQHATGYGNTYLNVQRRIGTILWDSNIKLPENARPRYTVDSMGVRTPAEGYRGEAFFGRPSSKVLSLSVTPRVIEARVRVAGPGPDTLTINQNSDPYWRARGGALLGSQGLLRVRCAPGPGTVRLTYHYTPFFLGLAISAATAVGLALVWLMVRRRRAGRFAPR